MTEADRSKPIVEASAEIRKTSALSRSRRFMSQLSQLAQETFYAADPEPGDHARVSRVYQEEFQDILTGQRNGQVLKQARQAAFKAWKRK